VQQQSSSVSQPAADDNVNFTANQTRQDEEIQYEDIGLQLGQTQHGPDADQYDSLNPQTQGEQPQYDVLSRPQKKKDAPDYVNVTRAWQLFVGPAADDYDTLSSETRNIYYSFVLTWK